MTINVGGSADQEEEEDKDDGDGRKRPEDFASPREISEARNITCLKGRKGRLMC